jgi:pSer/pThr/pTyr-binding forkhead associated (FHA) protein
MAGESGDALPGESGQRPLGLRRLTGWLVTFDLDPMGQDFRLFQGRHVIGSSPNCDIRLTVPGVSSEHAILLCRNDKFIIEDNLSSNGTFVNNEMIEDKVYLGENDIIRIATIELKLKSV